MSGKRTYDHRLRELVRRSGNPTIAMDLGVPRSTAMGWVRNPGPALVTCATQEASDFELRLEVVELRRRVLKLQALIRLLAVVIRLAGFSLTSLRIPEWGGQGEAAARR